jgi:hypothetical protein
MGSDVEGSEVMAASSGAAKVAGKPFSEAF